MNTAIIRRDFRESITFENIPTPETTKQLRHLGFDYDRRTGQWYRTDRAGKTTDEQAVVSQLTE